MSFSTDHELDLPLMSNNSEINVYHYILDLNCHFEEKQFKGHITIFCKPVRHEDGGESGKASEYVASSRPPFNCGSATQSSNTCCEKRLCSQNPALGDLNQDIDNMDGIKVKQEKCFANQSKSTCSLQNKKENNARSCSDEACPVVSWKRQKIFSATNATSQSESYSGGTNVGENDTLTGELESICESNQLERICKLNTKSLDDVSVDCSAIKRTQTESGNYEEVNGVPSSVSSVDDSKLLSFSICERMAVTNESNFSNINKWENLAEETLNETRTDNKQSSLLREQTALNLNCCSFPTETKNGTDKTHQFGKSESVIETGLLTSDSDGKCPRLPGAVISDTETIAGDFMMILDCWDITVEKVEEVPVSNELENISKHEVTFNENFRKLLSCLKFEGHSVSFQSDKRCVKIYKKGVKTAEEFPRVIRISYRTHPKGHSLKWTKDQDGRECVFTHGHWINNRSLFPSQDVPVAMATWQATIHVPQEAVALMSGDDEPTISEQGKDMLNYYYYTKLEMPSSTVSLAVGFWKMAEIVVREDMYTGVSTACPVSSNSLLPCRLFSPSCLHEQATDLISGYMPKCMETASQMLGPHPFKRLDILVVPSSFCSLGMASPSLMFISQSILSSDREMCIRLAHELSHSWFGLIIGPKDWTEEWLSEGFCTFTEGYLHGIVMQWDEVEKQEQKEIRDYLKFKTLEAESLSTEKDLQTLRPNRGELDYTDGEMKFVKNGMNPEKGFMQVHYLKGYFLLQYIETSVGTERFFQFLRSFVHKFSGKLVLSQDFLSLYFKEFPFLRDQGITEYKVYEDWLDNPDLHVFKALSRSTNSLASTPIEQVDEISAFNKKYRSLHWTKKRKLDFSKCLKLRQLKAIQVLLVLDILLCEDKVHTDVLEHIHVSYKLHIANADIQHKWCELVIKNMSKQHYIHVKSFLVSHQAMGVYLFGELILSRDKEQRKIAEDTFKLIADDMEDGVYKTVHLMIYGT